MYVTWLTFVFVNNIRCKYICIINMHLSEIDIDFRPVEKYRISLFKCLISKDDIFLIATCIQTSQLVKNMLPREYIFFNIFFDVFFINSLLCAGVHKYVRRFTIRYTPRTNCKFIMECKSFKITVYYGPMFTSHGFRLYNNSFFPHIIMHCQTVLL